MGGTVTNNGVLFASGAGGQVTITGPVNGGVAEVGNGVVDIQATSNENVSFQSGGSGELELAVASAYTGAVSESRFGSNHNQFIDLTAVKSSTTVHLAYTPNSSHPTSSGVLTVTSGGHAVASINMVGHYVTTNFHLGAGPGGDVRISDPPVVVEQKPGNAAATISAGEELVIEVPDSGRVTFAGPTGALRIDHAATFTGKVAGFAAQDCIDLTQIGFGAHTTLGYSENKSGAGGTLSLTDGTYAAKIALLGNYMAGSFITAADDHGGTLITEAAKSMNVQPLLTQPHTR